MGISFASVMVASPALVAIGLVPTNKSPSNLGEKVSFRSAERKEFALVCELPVDFAPAARRGMSFTDFHKALSEVCEKHLKQGNEGNRSAHLTFSHLQGICGLALWHRKTKSGRERDCFEVLATELRDLETAFELSRPLRAMQRLCDLLKS